MGVGTGQANTADYLLGRGILMLSPLAETGTFANRYEGFYDVGECSDFKLSTETELAEFKSSRAGLVTVVKRVVTTTKLTCSFVLHEISQEVRALFFLGEIVEFTQATISGATSTITLRRNQRHYDIINNSGGARIYKINNSPSIAAPTNSVASDFTIDATMGRVFANDVSGAAFADGALLTISSINADFIPASNNSIAAVPGSEMQFLKKSGIRGQLMFLGTNASNADAPMEVFLNRVSVSAEGDADQIGDDYQAMTIKGEAEKDATYNTLVGGNSETGTITTFITT